jgi:hypothetical protein
MLARRITLAAAGLALTACVSIPAEVKQTFEPPRPGETSYFIRRPDAPPPEGFVAPAPTPTPAPTPAPAPASTSACGPLLSHAASAVAPQTPRSNRRRLMGRF